MLLRKSNDRQTMKTFNFGNGWLGWVLLAQTLRRKQHFVQGFALQVGSLSKFRF